jgi:hypothetical protein
MRRKTQMSSGISAVLLVIAGVFVVLGLIWVINLFW